jgi:DNA repair protein RadC
LTNALKNSLSLLDVRVLDHLVIAGSQATSLAQRGLM